MKKFLLKFLALIADLFLAGIITLVFHGLGRQLMNYITGCKSLSSDDLMKPGSLPCGYHWDSGGVSVYPEYQWIFALTPVIFILTLFLLYILSKKIFKF